MSLLCEGVATEGPVLVPGWHGEHSAQRSAPVQGVQDADHEASKLVPLLC